MSKQRGLGRGLGAFFPNAGAAQAKTAPDERRVAMLDVESIAANPNQPRRAFDEAELEALSQSIRANGVLSPILVRASGAQRYEIIAGERRWRACKLAGLRQIPALVREADDPHALELALLENLQREDLNPIEEASGSSSTITALLRTRSARGSARHGRRLRTRCASCRCRMRSKRWCATDD